jgi:5-methylcytosine-specific restriction endonuclease McrA
VRTWGGRRTLLLTAETLAAKGTRCHLCGLDGADTADHIVPRSKGGPDTLGNLEPAHGPCNYARGDRDLDAWFAGHPLPRTVALAPSRQW